MSQEDTPPGMRVHRGEMSLDDRLRSMEDKIDTVLEQSNTTVTDVALVKAKLEIHDKILMGVCAVVGLTVLGALLVKVIH